MRSAATSGHVEAGTGQQGSPGPEPADLTARATRLAARNPRAADALRVVERSYASPQRQQAVMRLVEDDETDQAARWAEAAADRNYATAFGKMVRDPQDGHRAFTAAELGAWQRARMVQRSLNLTSGDALIPVHLDPTVLLSSDGSVDPMRAIARTVRITTGTWHGVSSTGVTSRWAAEESEAADDSPTLADPSIPVHKADSFVPVSIEALGDMMNAESELSRLFTDAKVQHEAPAFPSGSGVGEPTGAVSGLTAAETVATGTTGVWDPSTDPYTLLEALPPRFRPNASWLAALPIINELDQEETTNGAKKFPSLDDDPPRLLRKRIYEHSEVSDTIADGEHILFVGDFFHYVIVDRVGATIELIPHLFGASRRPTGQRGFYFYWRVGGAPVVNNAFRRLQVGV